MYQPTVYSNLTMGERIRPVMVSVPQEALQKAAELSGNPTNPVRVVNILHRTSALFPTNETTQWVR